MARRTIWLLSLTVLITLFFRIYELKSLPPGLYPDEAMNGSNALEALRTHQFKVFYPENYGREGLFINVQALFVLLLGREPWVLRLPAAIFGVLTVPALFALVRELFRRDDVALLASFFLATSEWHIHFSRIGLRAIAAPFFAVLSAYLLVRALRSGSIGTGVLAGLFFGLGFHTYIAFRLMPLVLVFFIPLVRISSRGWRIAAAFVVTTTLVVLPLIAYFVVHPNEFYARADQVSIASGARPGEVFVANLAKTIAMLNFRGDSNWRHNVSGRPELFWPVGVLFWVGVSIGCRQILKNGSDRASFVLLFGWFLIATLPAALSNEGVPHALRSILMIPPVMTMAAAGGVILNEQVWVWSRARSAVQRSLVIAFLSLLALDTYRTYFIVWAMDANVPPAFAADSVATARKIEAQPDSKVKYVFIEPGGVLVNVPGAVTSDGSPYRVPISAQPVMFLTDSWSLAGQVKHNIHYVVLGNHGADARPSR